MSEPCPRCHGTGVLPALKECGNENCRKLFRFQTGRSMTGAYRTRGVLYCSSKCARATANRAYRKRKGAA